MSKKKTSEWVGVLLLAAFIVPLVNRLKNTDMKIGKSTATREQMRAFDMFATNQPISSVEALVLSDDAANSTSIFPYYRFYNTCFGLQFSDDILNKTIAHNKAFRLGGKFNVEIYERILRTNHLTDSSYKMYLSQYLSATPILYILKTALEEEMSTENADKYMESIIKALSQERHVKYAQVSNLPEVTVTQQEIEETYLQHQSKFQETQEATIQLIACELNAEQNHLLSMSMQGRENISISDIADILKETVYTAHVKGDTVTSDEFELDPSIKQYFSAQAYHQRNSQQREIEAIKVGGMVYMYKITKYKKSHVKSLQDVRAHVEALAKHNKQVQYCKDNKDKVELDAEKQRIFELVEVLPEGALGSSQSTILSDVLLGVGKAAYSINMDPDTNVIFISIDDKIFRVQLESINYKTLDQNVISKYKEMIFDEIYRDLIRAYVQNLQV